MQVEKDNQRRQISDSEKYPKEFYFRDIVHDRFEVSLICARKYIHKQIIEQLHGYNFSIRNR